jgi:hypothetical protein
VYVEARRLKRWAATATHKWFLASDDLVDTTDHSPTPLVQSPSSSQADGSPESVGGRTRKTLSPSQVFKRRSNATAYCPYFTHLCISRT